jgi:hypothetical protein
MMTPDEAQWVEGALSAWEMAQRDVLRVEPAARPPTMVLYNESCVFRGEGEAPSVGEPHSGMVRLPDGNEMPAQVASFASPYADNQRVFFAMALPPIWRAGGVQSAEFGLENLMTAVLIHEITHTRQVFDLVPRFEAVEQRFNVGDEFTDDIVQDRFRDDAGFVAAYEAERDLFYAAVAAPTDGEARVLGARALAMMRARGESYFTGANEALVELEDIFLTMEGVAQWGAYAWLVHPQGAGVAPDTALPGMRRGGRQWSQDEGLAIFLLIDRLVPGWQSRVFDPAELASARTLLALAVDASEQ